MPESALPVISVIVPVYNVEDYLRQALDSLLDQNMPAGQLEIICVDDGSTDASPAILEEYAARPTTTRRFPIRVITQPRNYGYGRAMNTGMAAAQGEFIGFLEPDDFADANMFESLLAVAREHSADVVKANYFDHMADVSPDRLEEALRGYAYDQPLCADEDDTLVFIRACLWTAIYDRKLLTGNHIRFNETPGASYQDTAFAFQVFATARRLVLVRDAYVHYRLDNLASSTHSRKKDFAIYDEIALIEAFVNADAERRAHLGPAATYRSFWLHEWNRNRVSSDESIAIADTLMSAKLRRAQAEGTLIRRYYTDREWAEVERLLVYREPSVNELVEQVRRETEREYQESWSFRIGNALLKPARRLLGRR